MSRYSKQIIIGIFLILNNSLVQGNSKELDSLYQVLKTNPDEKLKAKLHGRICWLTINTNVISSQKHMDSARAIFNKIGDDKGIASADYKDGVIHRRQGNYELALEKFDKFMAYHVKMKDERSISNGWFQRGVVYSLQGNYNASLDEYYKLMNYYDKSNNIRGKGFTLNSIGIVYRNLNKFEDAKKAYLEVIEMLEGTEYKHDLANAYSNLGSIYILESKFEKALQYVQKAQEINISLDDNWGIGIGNNKIGEIYYEKGDLDKAETFFIKALEIQKVHNFKERAGTFRNLGEVKLKNGEFKKSEEFLQEALAMDLSLDELCQTHKSLSKLYKATNDTKLAFYHHEMFTEFNDSLRGIDNLKDINKLQYQFEASKKDNEIIQQSLVIKEQENELLQKEARSNRSLFIAGLAIIGLAFSFFFYRQKQKTKNKEIERLETRNELAKLESLIEGEEKERKRLAEDLHDGINGDLAVIKYNLVTMKSNAGNEVKNNDYKIVVDMLDETIGNVRSISHDLAPPSLTNFSLVDTISDYCMKISFNSELDIDFKNYGDEVKFAKGKEIAIFRIIQELLNNSIKHAHASEILVHIYFHEKSFNLTVEDNGKGYDTGTLHGGIGLRNIKSRAQFLGAELNVDSSNEGTLTTMEMKFQETS